MPDYITAGSFSRSSTPINIVRPKVKKYNLTDLRNDSEFNEITERFLSSIGQGDSVGDLFGYFRGADYNLADGIASYAESKKFTEQQKQDYQYLRNKFDNASIGGIGEWVKAGANVTKEMFTDPTMMASILFIPWTGGTSAAARIAASKAVQTGLKAMTSKELAKGVAKGVAKLPGQKIKEPLSKNAITAITSAEGMLYGSSNNFVRQNIDINTDRRDNINLAETAAIGAIGAALPVGVRGLGAGISKFQNSLADRRLARIEGGEDYKGGIFDKGLAKKDEIIDELTPNLLKLTRFVQKPTSIFKKKMQESDLLNKLIKTFRYDTDKSILDDPSKIVEKTGWSFFENINNRLGPKKEKIKEILDTLKEKGTVSKPKIGSRDAFFKLPSRLYDAPEATKQSYFKWQRISDPVNDALAYYLRTGRKTVDVDGKRISLERAFKMTEKTTDDVVKAGDEIKILLREIRNDAKAAGLEVGRIVNYLPRGFNFTAVKKELDNLKKGIEGNLVKEIRRSEGVTEKGEMIDILESILNPTTPTGKSYSLLMREGSGGLKGTRGVSFAGIGSKKIPSFTKKRQLRNIDETRIDDYLDNNVENLLYDYAYNSSSFIQRKIDLGEDLVEFEARFLKPIQKELREKGDKFRLTDDEYEKLIDIYLVTTGQVRQLDNGFRRALADIAIVGNQLSLLPLATITSLSEVAVPLVRGAGKKLIQKGKAGTEKEIGEGGIKTVWNTAGDYRKMWWNDVVKKDIADARPESLKELNRFGRAWDRASEDRSLAMFGQGYGRRGTMAQNKFFKINLLHDWTRFVQLTSFNVGKSKIYENLYELATVKNIKKARRIRLENQLRELNVDIGAGKRWVNNGGKPNGKFYNENFLPSAARYVDEVIMNPTAAANQKPLWHSMPSTRWAFGLMGFPTAFSNTVLKNAIREINFDVKTKTLQSTPEIAAGATAMISIGMFGNTLRTGGRNLEEIEKGEKTIGDEVFDAAIRTGLLGPTEQLYRTQRGTEYDNFARSIVQRFTGPAIDDIFRFFEDWNGPLSFAVDEAPGIALLRTANPEAYKAIVKGAREYDKAMGLTAKGKSKKEETRKDRPLFSQGGKVKLVNPRYKNFDGGTIDLKQNPVPNVVPEPSERINPYTGEPYEAEMERLGFAEGGNPAREERIAERARKREELLKRQDEIIKGIDENLNPLQKASLIPVPIASDIAGVAGDIQMYLEDPETKSWGNYALTGLGALPFVPSVAGSLKNVKALPKTYHGAKESLPSKLESFEDYTSEGSIYGDGFYTTSRKGTAKGYAGKEGIVYEIIPKKSNTKLFDMEDKIPTSIKKHLKKSYDNTGDEIGEYTGAILDFIDDNPKASLLDLYDEMRKLSPYHNMPKHEVLDQLYALNGILRNKGYKGLRHRGGVLTSSPEHEVNIFFDPQKDLNVKPIAEWYTEKQLKIMNRKPKKDGGLLVSIGVAPVSDKEISKLKKSLKKRQAKRNGGKAIIEEIEVNTLKRNVPEIGKEAYEYAINKLGENDLDKQFLKEIAFVESKYAKDKGTFRKDNRSAYQITPIMFEEFKDTVNPKNPRGRGLRAYTDNIKNKYNLDVSNIKYDDLNNPLIGTAVTRALWKLKPDPIGKTVEERAIQWKRDWNTEKGKGTVEKYLKDIAAMK